MQDADVGAVLSEVDKVDSKVHHLEKDFAERNIDFRAEFQRMRDDSSAMRDVVEAIGKEAVRVRTLLFVVLGLLTMGLPIAAVVTPWMARSAVREVLIEQGLLRVIQGGR